MRLSLARRITTEGIPEEMQGTVNNLATILNPFIEDVTTVLNGRIDFDNLSFNLVQFEVVVNSSGVPVMGGEVLISSTPRGSFCVNVQDASNINKLPDVTGVPFVMFAQSNSGSVKIGKILNLLPNKKYILTLLIL